MRDLIWKLGRILNRREKVQAVLLMAAMLVGGLLEMLGVGAIPAFISLLTNPQVVSEQPVLAWLTETLRLDTAEEVVVAAAVGLLALFLVKNAFLAALSWVQARYVLQRQINVARRLFATYLRSPYAFFLRRNTAELLRNTNQDALHVVGAGLMPLLQLAMEGFTVTAIMALLFIVEPVTSLAAFAVLGGTTAIFLRIVRARMLSLGEEERIHRRDMLQAVNEGIGGIKIIKVLGRESAFLSAFERASAGYAETGRVRLALQDLPRLTLETVAVAGLLAVASLLLASGRSATSLIPTLVLIGVAVVRMIPSFNRITLALNTLRVGRAAVEGVYYDLMALEPGQTNGVEPLTFSAEIRLEKVSFTYAGAASPSLEAVSLEIPKGSAVGFIGPTGSGKTTLVDIILGLLTPTEGWVSVDGQDLLGQERRWRQLIGYIPQDVYLSDASIRENIAFGLPAHSIDERAVQEAVEAAQLLDWMQQLPDGLDTMVGERGVRLSGGQRQRIAIARALYHDPAILVMDEATSALDNETEQYVLRAIEHLRGSRTLLLVAHRLSTVMACDCIYFLRRGKLVASGSYHELERQSPEFRKMLAAGARMTSGGHGRQDQQAYQGT